MIGIVGGTEQEPRVSLLISPQPVTQDVIALAEPVTPTEVFRFAAPCMNAGCVHFTAGVCRLASRIVQFLPEVGTQLPACPIRSQCRWWRQEGRAACLRCPQVVTDNYHPSALMREAATPESAREENEKVLQQPL